MENEIDKTKMLEKVNENLNELEELKEVEEMIKDNTIEFDFEEIKVKIKRYREVSKLLDL